ncbi:ATP-binding cassette domain-containing protein [Acidimicrobiia bacterium EGI L10123]|nr:ATP-binding cassette domain-containing protein [Acidimicrobiia bacterium EGI L10123]
MTISPGAAASPPDTPPTPLLETTGLTQTFRLPTGAEVQAVSDVSFVLHRGETLGLVGESGCGKSTTVRTILQAPPPTAGTVTFGGIELTTTPPRQLRRLRRRMQLVFQDPHASMNPRWTVRDCIAEPLQVHRVGTSSSRNDRVHELMDLVGLDEGYLTSRPGSLSGGQCQRVAIARALALDPDLICFDEAVSALDVSIQAQILNLIARLRADLELTSIFIAHDLAVVKLVSDRIGVMYLGKLCEIGPAESLYRSPRHPYTKALLSAIPKPDPRHPDRLRRVNLRGELPSPTDPPSGCRFRTRCDRADERCSLDVPPLQTISPGHQVACHYPLSASAPVEMTPLPTRRANGVVGQSPTR